MISSEVEGRLLEIVLDALTDLDDQRERAAWWTDRLLFASAIALQGHRVGVTDGRAVQALGHIRRNQESTATVGTMPVSLYRVLGRPVTLEGETSGTEITRQVETIDNDQAHLDVLAATDLSKAAPGTRLTTTVETIDNDEVGALATLEPLAAQADLGSARTRSVRQADKDTLGHRGAPR